MGLKKQKGAVLITLVIAMTLMAVLGAGIYSLTTSSSFGELLTNNDDNAYDLARAGIRYGVQNAPVFGNNFPTTTFSMPDANHIFTITINNGIITSTGVVNSGTFWEARRSIVANLAALWGGASPLGNNATINFTNDFSSFGSPTTSKPQAIQASSVTKTINMGGSVTDAYGSLWYQGSSIVGNCINGICRFGFGLRAYFEFTFNADWSTDSTASADGFTFAVMNAINQRDLTGGAAVGSQGELMGYAGPDSTTDHLGLKPPKMAIEFDTYPNTGAGDICSAGTRADPSPFADHAALMFWGVRSLSPAACSGYDKSSFDDNRHGAGGSGNDPVNGTNDADGIGYYEGTDQTCAPPNQSHSCNWMEDGYRYAFRIEIVRPGVLSGSTYDYQVAAWIVRLDSLSGPLLNHFQNVTAPFTDSAPQINKTAHLSAQDHSDFSKIFFGFTEATGANTQQIALANFAVFFPKTLGTCSYALSAVDNQSSPLSATNGSSDTVTVRAETGCNWATSNNGSTWITVTPASGKGTGTITYTATANTGIARNATITIGGHDFQVYQDSGCTYTIAPTSPNPASFSASAGSGTFSVGAGNGCAWTASSTASGWLHTASTGTGGGSGTYTVDANAGALRTGTIVVTGGQSFTVTQAGACPALSITTPTPANGIQGQSYSTTVSASGGSGTLTYSLTSGTLPTGLSLNASTGVISGTPTSAGTWGNIRVTVRDSCPSGAQTAQTGNFSIRIQFNPYRVYAGTGAPFYYSSGGCQTLSSGNYYNLSYNNSVTFYRNSGCAGSTMTVTYSNADTTDNNGDGDGTVQVNRSGNTWTLVDR